MFANLSLNLQLLRRALLGNAIFSLLSGLVCLVDAGHILALLQLDEIVLLWGLGVGLLGFGLLVGSQSLTPQPARSLVRAITLADALWVLGSLALVLINPTGMPLAGIALVLAVAFCVALFALLQWYGLGQFESGSRSTS